jgi:lysophospholipase L1-like esterase
MFKSIMYRLALMQFVLAILGICFFPQAAVSEDSFPFAEGDRVLFIGDSITQDGRYVDLIQGYLWSEYPDREITVLNLGLSSETVSGITEPIHPFPRPNVLDRLERALKLAKPDWVLVCYGMNDGIYHPVDQRIRQSYRQGLEAVVKMIDSQGARAILLSPPIFDAECPSVVRALEQAAEDEPYGYRKPYLQYDDTLVSLTNIARSFEKDPRVDRFIDVHASTHDFLRTAKAADPAFVYGDGVHPPLEGHAAMAKSILLGLGESEMKIDRSLARYCDVRPPGVSTNDLPADPLASQIRESLFQRGRTLSAALRKSVDPQSGPLDIETIDEAPFTMAAAAEAKIREMIDSVRQK